QLEPRLADRSEMGAHVLRVDVLGALDLETEGIAIEGQRRGQVFDRNADVIERGLHVSFPDDLQVVRDARYPPWRPPGRAFRPARINKSFAAVYGSSSRAAMRSTVCPSSPAARTSRSRCAMKRCCTSSRSRYSLRAWRRDACVDCE